jgi:plastocyanin
MLKKTLSHLILAAAIGAAAAWTLRPESEVQAAAAGGSLVGQVSITKDGDPVQNRSQLVVYLEGVPGALPDTSKMVFQVRQKNKQFTPSMTVALKGSTVEFPNDDKIFHNVFSLSRTARFDLGLYKSGASKSVKMRRSGVIDVYCNIHPEMVSKILVLETKYYAVTDRAGRFSLKGVPAGDYGVVVWQAVGKKYTGRVSIKPGAVQTLNVSLERGEAKGHKRKDGTPYGRYE